MPIISSLERIRNLGHLQLHSKFEENLYHEVKKTKRGGQEGQKEASDGGSGKGRERGREEGREEGKEKTPFEI